MNWKKNLIENLIYIVAFGLILIANNYMVIGQFEGMVNAAIAKESTAINHHFQTEIKKLKAKRGEVDLTVRPKLDSEITNNVVNDSVTPDLEKRKGFFKRLFGRKNKQ